MSEPDAPPEAPRNPIGWIALGLLFLMTAYGLVASFSSAGERSLRSRWLESLRGSLVTREVGARVGLPERDARLRRLERQLEPYRTTPEWGAYWIAIRTELREPTTAADAAVVRRSKEPIMRDIGEAYAMRPAMPAKALALARKLDGRGTLSRLAATHLREAAGLPGARSWIRSAADHYLLAVGVCGLLGGASFLAWAGLLVAALSGQLPKRGPPYAAQVPADADRLAMRAAALFFGFGVLPLPFAWLHAPAPARSLGVGIAMFFLVPLLLRRAPSFEEIVGAREGFGRKVLLGLWAFLLEIPVIMIVAFVGTRLFRGLPQNEHPASSTLMNTHDLATIASLLFFGAVVAPFWEETMFRGLLLPALRRVLNGPLPAALLSSFLFACIHPQGPGGWLGLTAFALCSCVLVNRTRSLVPSMVMHAAHNGTLLVLAVLIGS